MLIKMQKTRVSDEYFIIEDVKGITYNSIPLYFYTDAELQNGMVAFLDAPRQVNELRSCWYCTTGVLAAAAITKYEGGYKINRISFVNADGNPEAIMFDGEAYICNDEGRTIQKIRRGGQDNDNYAPPPAPAMTGGVTPTLA